MLKKTIKKNPKTFPDPNAPSRRQVGGDTELDADNNVEASRCVVYWRTSGFSLTSTSAIYATKTVTYIFCYRDKWAKAMADKKRKPRLSCK